MSLARFLMCVLFVALSAAACSRSSETDRHPATSGVSPSAAATATPDEFAATRSTFKENCVKCHGETGEGGPVTVDNKKLRVPSFKSDHAMKHKDEDFLEQINEGGEGMPAFKDKLKTEEMNMLVRFIRQEFQGK